MRQSHLFGTTLRNPPKEEASINAQLLLRGGFIAKLMSGIYSYLPLGWRVEQRIAAIIREELNALGAQEVFLPALQPKELWEETQRWDAIDVMYKFKDQSGRALALGPTHEEVIVDLARERIASWRDLPVSLYQIQTKFRDEPRAKSGLLRAREFLMKDLYSFHATPQDLDRMYEAMTGAYHRIFERCGVPALLVEASGGVFSKYSHEFMVETPAGEDIVYRCQNCDWAQNREIAPVKEGGSCPCCKEGTCVALKTVEVGNIFRLGTRFSDAMGLRYRAKDGKLQSVVMGCYGIGLGRLMGTIVERHHDDQGIRWPEAVAPFRVHLIVLAKEGSVIYRRAEDLYKHFLVSSIEILYDDRLQLTAGERLVEADLIGIPWRIVVSEKTGENIEVKRRDEKEPRLMTVEAFKEQLKRR